MRGIRFSVLRLLLRGWRGEKAAAIANLAGGRRRDSDATIPRGEEHRGI